MFCDTTELSETCTSYHAAGMTGCSYKHRYIVRRNRLQCTAPMNIDTAMQWHDIHLHGFAPYGIMIVDATCYSYSTK